MEGYWTGYSYVGLMPDGTWMHFSSDKEYEELYFQNYSRTNHCSI